jgi:microcin C transport system substrate-binding protein
MKKTINKKKIFRFFGLCFAAFLSLNGSAFAAMKHLALYGTAKYPDSFENLSYVNPQAPKGGRIVMPEYGTFDNFNPFIFKGTAASTAADLIWDSLGFSPTDDPETVYPLIAKEFEFPQDKSYVGFILDERARFADGSPVTADDVIFSFDVLIEKGAPIYRVYYGDVDHVEKVNDTHVRFIFKKDIANKELPLILSQLKIFPKKDWQDRDFSKPSLQIPLGGGPYKITRFSAGQYVVLSRDPTYWAADLPVRKGFFNFDEIRLDYYQDTTVTLQALFAGNIDVREEYIAKIWATGYDNEQVKTHRVIREDVEHSDPAVLQYFAFNLRRGKFQDKRVRQAIDLAFNFDWANEKLFYRQYRRLYSYFTNTGMEATSLPSAREKELLEPYRDSLDPSVWTEVFTLPDHSSDKKIRENLRQAVALLRQAGYDFVNGKMTNLTTKEPLTLEILSNAANGSSFTRVMMPFIANLKKIGIAAVFRNLEVNVFKNRMDHFDFDMAIMSYRISRMPGNELKEMFGSRAADVIGSYNIMGIQNPVVDALIEQVIAADERDEFETAVRALDRVLLSEHYLIFQWYAPYRRIAHRNKFKIPANKHKTGWQPMTWWSLDAEEK